ncbi:hypothetical protein [Capybara microvirus Cap3_SP_320]|nr:hypothetical protein [Capybara microvirus Cap3_SP_320]
MYYFFMMLRDDKFSRRKVCKSVYVDQDDFLAFEKRFPHCFSRFVRSCLLMSLTDDNFFDFVYWPVVSDSVRS